MLKNNPRGIFLLAVLLATFSVIAFVIPFPKNTVFWIAYLCGVFAILFQLYIIKTSFAKKDARSRFYGFPIARMGIWYLMIQMVVSIAEIALSKFLPAWVVIIVNVLILAVALIGCITSETMRSEIITQDRSLKKNVSNMRELQSLSASLVDQCQDAELKSEMNKLAEEFRYSDPLSSEKTMAMESDLQKRIDDLQEAITEGDQEGAITLCLELSALLQERNRVCAVNK